MTGTDLAGDPVRTEFTEAKRRRDLTKQCDDIKVLDTTSDDTHTHSTRALVYSTRAPEQRAGLFTLMTLISDFRASDSCLMLDYMCAL